MRVWVRVDSHPWATDHTFNKEWSCRHKYLPKVLTSWQRRFHCWYKYHTHSSNDAGNLILIVLRTLYWLTPVTCTCSEPIRSHVLYDTKDIFKPSTCCWETRCKNCARWVWNHIGLQCVRVCVCGLKLDRSEKPVLICQKECLWWGANSQWLQLAVETRARQRESERERESARSSFMWVAVERSHHA